jgi:hypothetical protein
VMRGEYMCGEKESVMRGEYNGRHCIHVWKDRSEIIKIMKAKKRFSMCILYVTVLLQNEYKSNIALLSDPTQMP